MRELVHDALLALTLCGVVAIFRIVRDERTTRLYCDDEGELLPITVVNPEDQRSN